MTTGRPLAIFHMDFNFTCLRMDYLRRWLRDIAAMGYDAVLWEVEDKVRWETCPECVWPEAMSKDMFREVLAYSRRLGLEPIPLLQTIGHAEYVLLKAPYWSFRERPDEHTCYCSSNPQVREFLKRWIGEYLEVFGDIRYFHLGGDEAYAFGSCPDCAAYAERRGRNALYADLILSLARPILDRGVRPGIWCDMVLHHPGEIASIPREFVIWDWNYWSHDAQTEEAQVWGVGSVNKKTLTAEILGEYPQIVDGNGDFRPFYTADFLASQGYDVILCSASRSAGDSQFACDLDVHYRNVVGAARKTATASLLGTCVTSWAVRLNSLDSQALVAPLAPAALREPSADAETLLRRGCERVFGRDATLFIEAARVLGKGYVFAHNVGTGVQWSRGKDSLPAPPGHIARKLAEWKADGSWETLDERRAALAAAFPEAVAKLSAFLPTIDRGFEFLEPWLAAGHFQLEHCELARLIATGAARPVHAAWAETLKARFEAHLARWETPLSAAKNAGLAYDCLIERLRSGGE